MNRNILLILLYINAGFIVAQNETARHDSLLRVGLTMTRYEKDTSADAIILSTFGTVQIVPEYPFIHKYFRRSLTIKILSEAGLSNGLIAIPVMHNSYSKEEVTQLDAITYNLENGKIVATNLDKKEIHLEKFSSNINVERFAMPKVKVGSLIYVSYTINSPFPTDFQWDFQQRIPVVYSQFTLLIPPHYDFVAYKQYIDDNNCIEEKWQNDKYPKNVFKADMSYGYDDIVCRYTVKDVSAFKDESFITTPKDYVMQIGFQLSKSATGSTYSNTWQEFTNNLLFDSYFGDYYESKRSKLVDILDQLKIKGKSQKEKIKAIVNYVKANYRWDKWYSYRTSKKMSDFLDEKSGNSADVNLFLIGLLRAADIDAKPVLLSTRGNGKIKIKTHPLGIFFNDVICYAKTDSVTLLLDATEPILPYYAIPPQCMNDYGFIVEKNDSSWIDLKPQSSATTMKSMLVKFSPECDSINCSFTIKASGYSGFNYRKDWDAGYEAFNAMHIRDKGMELKDSIKVYSKDDLEEPFSIYYSVALPVIKQKADSLLGVDKIIVPPFLNQALNENPLKMNERKYPVDMTYKHYSTYQSMIVIPAGYKISSKPEDADYSVAKGKATFSYKIKQISDNVLQATSSVSFNTPVFQPDEYKELKSFYDYAVKKYKEPIVMEKK